MDSVRALRRIYAIMSPRGWGDMIVLLAVMLVNAATEVVGVASVLPLVAVAADPTRITTQPWLHWIYQHFGFHDASSFLIFLGVMFLALVVAVNALNALTGWMCLRYSMRASHSLSTTLFKRYLYRSHAWFLRRHTADLARNVLEETDRLVERFILTLTNVAMWGTIAIFLVVGLLWLDPLVAIVSATTLSVLYIGIYRFFESRIDRIGRQRADHNASRFRTVTQSLAIIKETRAQSQRDHFITLYGEDSRRHHDALIQQRLLSRFPTYFTETLAITGIVVVLIYLSCSGRGAQLAVPLASLYLMATWRLVPALQHMYSDLVEMRFYLPLLHRMDAEFSEPLPDVVHDDVEPLALDQTIRMKDIFFTYEDAEGPALRGITLDISRGTSTAFVGRTGAGKTTLADVLSGHLIPCHGSIEIDRQPLTSENVARWQKNIGYVPQEIFLIDDTVRANIALGVPPQQVDEEALRRAARLAHIDEFIENRLAKKYDTMLGERGVLLSGGERQRIGIARALYHDPQVLILDEATSSLDNLTELAVMEALRELAHVKTTIVIAHRLSTVQACDTVVLLEHGEVIGRGSYASLLESSAAMRELATATLVLSGESLTTL